MKNIEAHTINDFKDVNQLDYINQIWLAIMEMDSLTLEMLLDEKIDYEDIGKDKFIEKLYDKFQEHRTWGDSELLMDFDSCNGCNCNQPVCKFIGNHSRKTFALYFEIQKKKITDIYHCNWYGDKKLF